MALGQLRKGFTSFGVPDEMSKYPHLFKSVFTFRPVELTPATVKGCLRYSDELSEKEQDIKAMMTRFVEESQSARLIQFMQFCTGSKVIPSVQNFGIK